MHVHALEADKLAQVDTCASPTIICATRCRLNLEKASGTIWFKFVLTYF